MQIHQRPLAAAITMLLLIATSTAIAGVTPIQIAKLLPSEAVPEDEFARSLDLDGDIAVVGAPFDDELAADAGAVYVYRKTEGEWALDTKLFASDGVEGDEFGTAVTISGNRIVVTAIQAFRLDVGVGMVYTFEFDGADWIETNRFNPSLPTGQRRLGTSLSLDGDVLAVSIFLDLDPLTPTTSAAILYHWNGSSWSPEHIINQSAFLSNKFTSGPAIDVDGQVAVIGDYRNSDLGALSGAVSVLRRNNGVWSEEATLHGSTTLPQEQFGWSVDIDGDTIVVGTEESNQFYHRVVYVFRIDGDGWAKEAELMAGAEAFEEPFPLDDAFGYEVAISGDTIISCDRHNFVDDSQHLTVFKGATYIYQRTGTAWAIDQRFLIEEGGVFERFGTKIVIEGATALFGNNRSANDVPDPSAAFLVNLCGTDINNDSIIDSADLGLLIAAFGIASGGPTDINNDGITDTADLGMLIADFGTACP